MTCCIYWIHLPEHTDMTKEGYIGLSTNFEVRMKSHFGFSNKEDTHVYRAIRKYGWDNLVKEVLVISTLEYCKELEFKLRPLPSIGWNEIIGGNTSPSKNPLVAEKISKALTGREGKPHTEATKLLISEGNRNRVLSEESRKKIADAMRTTQLDACAKEYIVTFPDGRELTIKNLTLWCTENGLQARYVFRVASGKRKQYKGYKFRKLTKSDNSPVMGGAN